MATLLILKTLNKLSQQCFHPQIKSLDPQWNICIIFLLIDIPSPLITISLYTLIPISFHIIVLALIPYPQVLRDLIRHFSPLSYGIKIFHLSVFVVSFHLIIRIIQIRVFALCDNNIHIFFFSKPLPFLFLPPEYAIFGMF